MNDDAPLHRKARAWIEEVLSSGETVAFSWIVVLAFL
jgi:predicted nucleic acid-binding protein